MFKSAGSVERLANRLARLPGIGRKSAARLAFHILKLTKEEAFELADTIREVKEKVGFCSVCNNISETDPCQICDDPKRDKNVICVVASIPDLWAVEESGAFRGTYHVLHGLLAPLDGVGPDDLQVESLCKRVIEEKTSEVIVATRPSVEGEATAVLVRQILKDTPARVTRIASGVSYGGEIEYADRVTLSRALDGRQDI